MSWFISLTQPDETDLPIVFHSGHVTPAEVRALYPDAVACAKPCPPDRLIDAMQEAVGKANA